MTWDIVIGIIALVGFLSAVGGIVYKLAKILTSLETTMKGLNDTLQELKKSNSESHSRIHERIDGQGNVLAEHDKRISILEHK